MSYQQKVIGISLAILVLITASLFIAFYSDLSGNDQYSGVGYALLMLFTVGAEFVLLIFIGLFIRFRTKGPTSIKRTTKAQQTEGKPLDDITPDTLDHKERAFAFFSSALIVLLVGASLCFGGLAAF